MLNEEEKYREIRKLIDLLEKGYGNALCNSDTDTVNKRFHFLMNGLISQGMTTDDIAIKIYALT
jgi:hypothetical protein